MYNIIDDLFEDMMENPEWFQPTSNDMTDMNDWKDYHQVSPKAWEIIATKIMAYLENAVDNAVDEVEYNG